MRVRVTRRGGIAGVPMVADVDTAELDPAQAVRADDAIARVRAGTQGEPAAPSGADRFRFHLSLPDADDPGDVVVGESAVPDGLRPLLDLAADRAQPGA